MIISLLELKDFRNYETLELPLSKDINILYGDNAQGKTNVLEALYLCSTTKSHKGAKDREMIRIGASESHLRMQFKRNTINHKIDIHLKSSGKGVAVDGVPARRSSDVYGMMNIVLFSPEDLTIIKNGPAERRKFMDSELCQLDRAYLKYLSDYNKTLAQRNDLLKAIQFKKELRDTLEVWDDQLVKYGSFIIEKRAEFIKGLNEIVGNIHGSISGGKEKLSVSYAPSVDPDDFKKTLSRSAEKDLSLRTTTVGPHRDELVFDISETDVKHFGSQGQQRTAALSVKMAEIELVKKKIGENPVLLLDDVLSELDRNRQQCLLNSIDGIQTVITCTGLEEFVGYRSRLNTLYKVTNGTIEKV